MSKELQSLDYLSVLELGANKIKKIKNINTGQIAKSMKVLNLSNYYLIQATIKYKKLRVLIALKTFRYSISATMKFSPSETTIWISLTSSNGTWVPIASKSLP